MGIKAKKNRRAKRTPVPRRVPFHLKRSKAQNKTLYSTSHLGSGAIKGLSKVKD
jgi:hypothetical protein